MLSGPAARIASSTNLNALAQEDWPIRDRFVTLFLSIPNFDPLTGCCANANAAHNHPLICRSRGLPGRGGSRMAPGLLIGPCSSKADYGCQQVVLEPEDVILYSPMGSVKPPASGGERFDEDRLIPNACQSRQPVRSACPGHP